MHNPPIHTVALTAAALTAAAHVGARSGAPRAAWLDGESESHVAAVKLTCPRLLRAHLS